MRSVSRLRIFPCHCEEGKARRGNPVYVSVSGLPLYLTAARNGEGESNRCVSLIAQLCKAQAAVVSPLRRVNQAGKSSPL